MKKKMFAALLPILLGGCFSSSHQIDSRSDVNIKPIEIKPIHITIDVNVKVDRALDDFFDDVDKTKQSKTVEKNNIPANQVPENKQQGAEQK